MKTAAAGGAPAGAENLVRARAGLKLGYMLPSEPALRDLLEEGTPRPDEVGWFIARQPGAVGFFERALGPTDAFAVALEGALRLCGCLERRLGVPPARVTAALMDRAYRAVQREARTPAASGVAPPMPDDLAARQPELLAWAVDFVAFAPAPLSPPEARAAGACLAALLYALDEVTTGRPVP